MKVYVGNAGRLRDLALMREWGWGRLVSATSWKNPVAGIPWALDNGAYSDWLAKVPFNTGRFLTVLGKVDAAIRAGADRPDFIVIPDLVAGGDRSLWFSHDWMHDNEEELPDERWYLAVQDGMDTPSLVSRVVDALAPAGIFVGGTLAWKHRTAEAWVRFAHERGFKCHIGRVPTLQRLKWAERIGADSVDSTTWPRNDTYHILHAARKQRIIEAEFAGDTPGG